MDITWIHYFSLTILFIIGSSLGMEPRGGNEQNVKEVRLKVLTLNCWGVPLYGSQLINERFRLIGRQFADSEYDAILFQEVWRDVDYRSLVHHLHNAFPYFHYFYSGFVGSGCCIFSKWRIQEVIMHQYSLNGYIHKLMHADFLASKALNGAVVEKDGLRVALFTTHLHAEYDHDNDEYLAHRVAQAYELSELIRWTHRSFDGVILGGDLNLQPKNLGYQLILANAGLKDAWKECETNKGENDEGSTCDIPSNTWVKSKDLASRPKGQRIDYIMYRDGSGDHSTSCASCRVFSGKGPIPGDAPSSSSSSSSSKMISFSDHEGVEAELIVRPKLEGDQESIKKDNKLLKGLLEESLRAFRRGLDKVHSDRVFCVTVIAVALFVLLQFFYCDQVEKVSPGESPSSSSSSSSLDISPRGSVFFLPHVRLINLGTWFGFLLHKLLLVAVVACSIHALLVSTFEQRALMALVHNIQLRLQNMA